ncbi:MAG TPA: RluA family pseudouridine synthase, partial [Puia sp.]|nr:RluA family pseudouridine synthase [Puia sp.]
MHDKSDEDIEEISEQADELYERMSIKVDKGQEPMRIDKFLVQRMEHASRNKVQHAIEAGRVLVNNKTTQPNHKIKPQDEIVVYSDKQVHGEKIIPEKIDLNIFYEDGDILIINKPAGLVVHPASGNYTGTLINGVAYYLQQTNNSINEENLTRFGLVHRIDKNTSGLMVIAKTEKAVTSLAKQFFNHTVKRQYMALVWGDILHETGSVAAHVGRHKRFRKLFDAYPDGDHGKEAITHYKVLERFG